MKEHSFMRADYESPFCTEGEKIGVFVVGRAVMMRHPEFVMDVLSNGIVVRAELMWNQDGVEYQFICSEFDPILPGYKLPNYFIDVIEGLPNEPVKWSFRREDERENVHPPK